MFISGHKSEGQITIASKKGKRAKLSLSTPEGI
jgi:hypothetical protein